MRGYLKIILGFLLVVLFALGIYNIASIYSVKLLSDNISYTIINKNMKNGISLGIDNKNNIYVAKKTQIRLITPEGKEKILISNGNYDIEDMLHYDNSIYYLSKTTLYKLDLDNLSVENYLENIPLSGNNIERKLFVLNGEIGLTIGSYSNSGISEGPNFDIPPVDVTLNGNNYGENENIAYCKKPGIKCEVGEKIEGQKVGNAAIYIIDNKTKELKLYASGIRSVTGIDVDSEGNVYAAIEGMENKGLRPVSDDSDYIYEIKKGLWYGFPDYSGGDYIESPRFQDEEGNLVKPILLLDSKALEKANGPIFVSQKQNTIKCCAIDKDGKISKKDNIIFYDKNSKELKALSKEGNIQKVLSVSNNSNISDIIYNNNELYIMDSSLGYVYKISLKEEENSFYVPKNIWIFITGLSFILLIIFLSKLFKFTKK